MGNLCYLCALSPRTVNGNPTFGFETFHFALMLGFLMKCVLRQHFALLLNSLPKYVSMKSDVHNTMCVLPETIVLLY